jgi:hypothetical protein
VIEDRARRVGAGFVGSGDLFEVFLHEVRRAGWPVEQVQAARPVRPSPRCRRWPTVGGRRPIAHSRRRDVSRSEIRSAVEAGAASTVRWFSRVPARPQVEVTDRASRRRRATDRMARVVGMCLAVARMLWWRGQRPYAAQLLERVDLGCYGDHGQVSDIAVILSTAGRPCRHPDQKVAHAHSQLAAFIVAQPADQAAAALLEWWRSIPGIRPCIWAVLTMVPTLSLVDAAAWHDRMRSASRTASPLLAVARDALPTLHRPGRGHTLPGARPTRRSATRSSPPSSPLTT